MGENPDYYAKVSQVMKTVPSLMDIDLSKVKTSQAEILHC